MDSVNPGNANEQKVVSDFARQIVAEVAPDELSLFRPLSQAYFKNPEKALRGDQGKDQMLGFGAMEVMAVAQTLPILQATWDFAVALGSTGLPQLILGAGPELGRAGSELGRLLSPLEPVGRHMAELTAAHAGFLILGRVSQSQAAARAIARHLSAEEITRLQASVLNALKGIEDEEKSKRAARAMLARVGIEE